MQLGEEATRGKYQQFRQAVKDAEYESEVHAVAIVRKHMDDNWTAAMTYLERKFPERWSRGERIEHSGPDGGPIQVEGSFDWHTVPLWIRKALVIVLDGGSISRELELKIMAELEGREVIDVTPQPKQIAATYST